MRFKVQLVRASKEDITINMDYRRRFISLLKKFLKKSFMKKAQNLIPLRFILESIQT